MERLAQWRREHGDSRALEGDLRTTFRFLVANARWEGACWIDLGELLGIEPSELRDMVGSIPRYGESPVRNREACTHERRQHGRRKRRAKANWTRL